MVAEENNTDIRGVVAMLSTRYDIERIYVLDLKRGVERYDLVVFLSNKYVKDLGALVPKIRTSISDFPRFKVQCFIARQAKKKLLNGNLFLFNACRRDKLIYCKTDSRFSLHDQRFNSQICLERAIAFDAREQKKLQDFREGYYHFRNIGRHSLAAFMLHQAMELAYRYLELLLTAKEKITHSIRCHHIYLEEICSTYGKIFDGQCGDDQGLLHILEGVYRGPRYEDDFQIDLETLKQLEYKMENLLTNTQFIAADTINRFEKMRSISIVNH